ncbi:MAG: hypothetical protein K9J37_11915 [Saprospiraceae bacterium]|nr:hypothetical protein [Saprospiraceae bacterium]MCF8250614.1 hypothetical protein [Saprospiraceae bacterium]MCF8282389.1 hypothetical protein [Bacteroidales bacterium]MCF8312245.1 hypothetical protein [Saprospiraceae bacterium]MCF8442802.1 hypothetical protein [Saprospiraceae bacterium]
MKKLLLFNLLFATLLFGCKADPNNNQGGQTTETTIGAIDPATINFVCETAEAPNEQADAPHHEVYLQLGNSKVKVADILNCENLGKDAYEQNQIPAKAIAAVGGWWAGGGDYLYIIEEGGNYVVKKGAIFEESENMDFGYKTIMTFSKAGEQVF